MNGTFALHLIATEISSLVTRGEQDLSMEKAKR